MTTTSCRSPRAASEWPGWIERPSRCGDARLRGSRRRCGPRARRRSSPRGRSSTTSAGAVELDRALDCRARRAASSPRPGGGAGLGGAQRPAADPLDARGRLREPLLGEAPRPRRPRRGPGGPRRPPRPRRGRGPRQSASAPAASASTAPSSTPTRRADGAHLERVGDHHPVEAELVAQQPVRCARLSVAGTVVERRARRMCAVMIDCTPASIAARNGHELAASSSSRRPRRSAARGASRLPVSPWPGKCFAHAATPRRWSPVTNAATCRATSAGSEPNERTPITGLRGFVFTSATGARSRLIAAGGELAADRRRDRARSASTSSTAPSARLPGYELPVRGLEPGDVAALLVDRDQRLGPLGADRGASAPRAARGRATLRANRTTPPSPPASSRRTQSGGASPAKPGQEAGATRAARARPLTP